MNVIITNVKLKAKFITSVLLKVWAKYKNKKQTNIAMNCTKSLALVQNYAKKSNVNLQAVVKNVIIKKTKRRRVYLIFLHKMVNYILYGKIELQCCSFSDISITQL